MLKTVKKVKLYLRKLENDDISTIKKPRLPKMIRCSWLFVGFDFIQDAIKITASVTISSYDKNRRLLN